MAMVVAILVVRHWSHVQFEDVDGAAFRADAVSHCEMTGE